MWLAVAMVLNTGLGIVIGEHFGWAAWGVFMATWCPATGLAAGYRDAGNLRR